MRGADAPRGDGFAWDEVAGMVRCAACRYHELARRAAYDGVRPKLASARVAARPGPELRPYQRYEQDAIETPRAVLVALLGLVEAAARGDTVRDLLTAFDDGPPPSHFDIRATG